MRKTEIFQKTRNVEVQKIGNKGYLACMDGVEFLRSLNAEVADLVFLDPPFNLGKEYGGKKDIDRRSEQEYQAFLESLIKESIRIMTPGAALYLYHLPKWAMRLSPVLLESLELRHWISISMKNGFVRGDKLYPAHYALIYLTKGKPKNFSRPKLQPVKCRHCGELIRDYGGYRKIIERQGINLSDVWDDLSPVRHLNRKQREFNELPSKLTDRVVEISGKRGGLLVDPCIGSGTSIISAVNGGMKFVGNDLIKRNLAITRERLEGLGK